MAAKTLTIRDAALELLIELEGNCLEVVLIPSGDPDIAMRGGMIRAVQSANAEWYQDFCASYPSSRRRRRLNDNDTCIRRKTTVKALERIMEGKDGGIYGERLQPYLDAKLKEMRDYYSRPRRIRW